MTRRQLSTTAKLEEKTKRISGCEIYLSPKAGREAEGRGLLAYYSSSVVAGSEKPQWSTVKGADLEVQQLYAKWGGGITATGWHLVQKCLGH